ncbi:hypothetical protein K7G91_001822 [Pasteurella canis]|uniref:hypothetical protein n=1 Tax=Pasteurella canis TaxID=753 RepID=UPI001D10991D|nr:hypothetical protein [Pasteurella canis]UDW83460.1 hypothetical protein K7G91_001822 [Pasteurella canis]
MKTLFKLLLAISSTSLLPIIFLIKSRVYLFKIDFYKYISNETIVDFLVRASLLGYFIIPLIFFFFIFYLLSKLSKDNIKNGEVIEVKNATNSFLPNFLGYFFVALSIADNDYFTLFVIYILLTIFVYLSQINYFNPLFLMFGYTFYNIKTKSGLSILLISKSKYKIAKDICSEKVYRINDFTFINK